jgi:hypothetical protein
VHQVIGAPEISQLFALITITGLPFVRRLLFRIYRGFIDASVPKMV